VKNGIITQYTRQRPEVRDIQMTPIRNEISINRVASAIVAIDDNPLNLNEEEKSGYKVRVNGKEVECIYDSGTTCCVVKRTLIDKSDLTGKEAKCVH
jgi:hypothetical protein